MTEEKIKRINELAKKKREGSLSAAEQAEQAALRREYIDSYKRSLISQLEHTYIVDEKGNKKKVEKRK